MLEFFKRKSYTLKLGFKNKWKKDVILPAKGKFVCESHYATTEDEYSDGRPFPRNQTEGIDLHLGRSFQLLKQLKPGLKISDVYPYSFHKVWTPAENGLCGQAARGNLKPTPEQEMWQGNCMFRAGELPKPGTKFLVQANGKSCVIQMGFEIGPGSEKYLGGVTPEVHWWLGTNNDSEIKLSFIENQSTPLGPVMEQKKPVETPTEQKSPPWFASALRFKGKKETDPEFSKFMVPKWKLFGMNLGTIAKSWAAWCGLATAVALAGVGLSYQKDGALARNWGKYGVAIEWKRDGIPQGAIIHINHKGNCTGGSGNHVTMANGYCSPNDLAKPGATFDGFGGNQNNTWKVSVYPVSHICAVRWPKEVARPPRVTQSKNCTSGSAGNESTR